MMCERILLWSLSSLMRQLRTVSYSVSCWVNIFSLANYTMLTSLGIFRQQFLVAESCMRGSLLMQFLSTTISWRHISQGRIATRLRCGGIFNYTFVANLSLSLTVKEFWKSINIWQSYHHEFGGPVFLEHNVVLIIATIKYSQKWRCPLPNGYTILCAIVGAFLS